MSTEENKTVVRRFFEELLSTDNLAIANELLSPTSTSPAAPSRWTFERYKECLPARRGAFPDCRFVVEVMRQLGVIAVPQHAEA